MFPNWKSQHKAFQRCFWLWRCVDKLPREAGGGGREWGHCSWRSCFTHQLLLCLPRELTERAGKLVSNTMVLSGGRWYLKQQTWKRLTCTHSRMCSLSVSEEERQDCQGPCGLKGSSHHETCPRFCSSWQEQWCPAVSWGLSSRRFLIDCTCFAIPPGQSRCQRHLQAFPHLFPVPSSLLQLWPFLSFFSSLELSHLHLNPTVLPLGRICGPDLGYIGSFVTAPIAVTLSHHVLQDFIQKVQYLKGYHFGFWFWTRAKPTSPLLPLPWVRIGTIAARKHLFQWETCQHFCWWCCNASYLMNIFRKVFSASVFR